MEIPIDELLGPRGLVVGLLVVVWAFFTGKIRRESDVIDRDKRIDVLEKRLDASERARLAEREGRREAVGVAVELARVSAADVEPEPTSSA